MDEIGAVVGEILELSQRAMRRRLEWSHIAEPQVMVHLVRIVGQANEALDGVLLRVTAAPSADPNLKVLEVAVPPRPSAVRGRDGAVTEHGPSLVFKPTSDGYVQIESCPARLDRIDADGTRDGSPRILATREPMSLEDPEVLRDLVHRWAEDARDRHWARPPTAFEPASNP